jgi:hypothetical protein
MAVVTGGECSEWLWHRMAVTTDGGYIFKPPLGPFWACRSRQAVHNRAVSRRSTTGRSSSHSEAELPSARISWAPFGPLLGLPGRAARRVGRVPQRAAWALS